MDPLQAQHWTLVLIWKTNIVQKWNSIMKNILYNLYCANVFPVQYIGFPMLADIVP